MRSRRALSSVVTAVGSGALLLGLCAGTSATATAAAADAEPPRQTSAAERAERLLRADAVDPVTVSADGDGDAAFVGTVGEPVADPQVPAGATPVRAAREHLDRYGAMFGVPRPEAQLETTEVVEAPAGSHVVTFNQEVDGVPVLAGELAVSVDGEGDLESVNGETTDATAVPAPVEPAAAAVRTAVRVTARSHDVHTATLTAGPAGEWYYDPELLGSPDPEGPRPVWRVEVSNGADIRELVLVETSTGQVAAHVNQVPHALNRVVCNRRERDSSARPCTNPVRTEAAGEPAGPFGRGDDVAAGFSYAGDASRLYRTLGIDLTRRIGVRAGNGRQLRVTVNLPGRNAFWSGREAYFSTGFALADDVVAHELTHGVIQHTSNLFYWYQSGAINESMADVFGEIVDQRNGTDHANRAGGQRDWLLGEDSRAGVIRDMRNPTRQISPAVPRQPDRMRSRFYLADRFLQDNGGVHVNSGVGNKAAFLIAAGGRFNGISVRGLDEAQDDRRETARVYFRALQMLTSGSDYADLGRVLPQACRALVGTGRGADRITRRDCANVGRAVRATEMHLQPRVATAPEAPGCARSANSRRLFFDNFERNRRRTWATGRLWSRAGRYATSGTDSLHGRNPVGRVRHSTLTLRRNFQVRRRGRTFLRFDHSRLFEYNLRTGPRAVYFDGGRVEFSTNRGRTWRNAASLRWVNGPREGITLGRNRPQFRGFGGDSHGYMSSRLDLSRFGGRTVRLRWVVSGDRIGRGFGWYLDDVEMLHCR